MIAKVEPNGVERQIAALCGELKYSYKTAHVVLGITVKKAKEIAADGMVHGSEEYNPIRRNDPGRDELQTILVLRGAGFSYRQIGLAVNRSKSYVSWKINPMSKRPKPKGRLKVANFQQYAKPGNFFHVTINDPVKAAFYRPKRKGEPTKHRAGTPGKVEILAQRMIDGEELFHRYDNPKVTINRTKRA